MRERNVSHLNENNQLHGRPGNAPRRQLIQFPAMREQRATEPGVDDLVSSLEFFLQDRPRVLRSVRKRYRRLRIFLLAQIEYVCRELDAADREPAA
jgi:hypothetical protein